MINLVKILLLIINYAIYKNNSREGELFVLYMGFVGELNLKNFEFSRNQHDFKSIIQLSRFSIFY